MGLRTASGSEPVAVPDLSAVFGQMLDAAHDAGIARALTLPDDPTDEGRLQVMASALLEALEESPQPATEWVALQGTLGTELLAKLVDVSLASLHRYTKTTRATPDTVAARLHWLALVVSDVAGAYNDHGVRRWFSRPRTQLDGQTPATLLAPGWAPHEAGPERVRALAASLAEGLFT